MGTTGSGKSTFINLASGGNLKVGESLQSCTSEVVLSPLFSVDNREVLLVDTPGFDDTTKSEAEILAMLTTYLARMYEGKRTLTGVIYLHRISDTRVGGMSTKNFRVFRELCGEDTLKNVAIVTNRWEEVPPAKGAAREEELRTRDLFFKVAIDKGAQLVRHQNTSESAATILRDMVTNNAPLPLLIQEEMVDKNKQLSDTAVGQFLSLDLSEQMQRLKNEVERLQNELKSLKENRDEGEEELRSLQGQLAKAEESKRTLAVDYDTLKRQYEEMLRKTQSDAERKMGIEDERPGGQPGERFRKKWKKGKIRKPCIIM
ncbi:hypothetical protein PM082_002127 [Marasmius tenuissimus]|nr:hypothetical protein PM082_002127 [Marasmius tenuissimus]